MRKFLLNIIALLFSFSLSAQDLTGIWQGVLYQVNSTGIYYFVYTFNIQQTGNNVNSTSYATAYGSPYYAYYTTVGSVNNNILTFNDVAITESQAPPGNSWCMKYGDLTFDPAKEKLYGTAQGLESCPPFEIELYRLTIKADTNHCAPKNVPIVATGQNLRWYADKNKQTLLASGGSFTPFVSQTTTYYVTQTIYDTESPVVPFKINVFSTPIKTQSVKICEGQSLVVADTVYKTTGIYTKKLKTNFGCDSLINTTLTVSLNKKNQQTLNICEGQSISVGLL
jgi:Ig-like domain CHU_C associated